MLRAAADGDADGDGDVLIFAVGSLINDASRASTVPSCGAAAAARLLPAFGASRAWCFRAASALRREKSPSSHAAEKTSTCDIPRHIMSTAFKRLQRELSGGAARAGVEGTFIRVRLPRARSRARRARPPSPSPTPFLPRRPSRSRTTS